MNAQSHRVGPTKQTRSDKREADKSLSQIRSSLRGYIREQSRSLSADLLKALKSRGERYKRESASYESYASSLKQLTRSERTKVSARIKSLLDEDYFDDPAMVAYVAELKATRSLLESVDERLDRAAEIIALAEKAYKSIR